MPDKDIKEMIEEQGKAFHAFKEANDENIKKRDVLLESKIDKLNTELDKFEPINQKLTMAEAQAKAMQEQMDRMETILNRPDLGGGGTDAENKKYLDAFNRAMRVPVGDRDPEDLILLKNRTNSLIKGDDVSAGYLLAPPDMLMEIIKDVVEISPMRSLCTVRTIGGPSLKQPKKTGSTTATRVGEVNTRSNTGDMTYGLVEIQCPEMYTRCPISQQMLEDSEYDLLGEIKDDSVEQFAYKEGYEFINGIGAANQAEGILVNGDIGEEDSGSATLLTADGLMTLYYSLKTAYARNAVWIMRRSTIGAVRKLTDDNGQYLWTPGIAGVVPNTILDAQYIEMPDMPAVAANAYPVAFGDFKRGYVIVDKPGVAYQTDYMTEADNGLVIFRGRKRTGGGVRQAEAIKKLKISL